MKLLLDTCAMIWLCAKPEELSPGAVEIMDQSPQTDLFISDATILEVAIKNASGKLTLPAQPRDWFKQQCDIWGIVPLPLSHEELYRCAEMPWHHRDPFDRLIIATAISHRLPVVSKDRFFEKYGIEIIW
jgi:PIN domain nuclease of toxin-antitoxin system